MAVVASAVIASALPIIIAAIGESILERTGRVNLGLEGIMAFGAAAGALAGGLSGSLAVGLASAALAGMLLALVYIVLVDVLGADMIVSGLLVFFAGIGLGDLIGNHIAGRPGPVIQDLWAPFVFFLALGVILHFILYKTPYGVIIRAVGESEAIARDRGLNVLRVRIAAAIAAGILGGIAGYIMVAGLSYGKWYSGVTAGMGWVALGVVILGYWTPLGAAFAGLLVGLLFSLRTAIAATTGYPELVDTIPYAAVLAMLAAGGVVYRRLGIKPPASIWRD